MILEVAIRECNDIAQGKLGKRADGAGVSCASTEAGNDGRSGGWRKVPFVPGRV